MQAYLARDVVTGAQSTNAWGLSRDNDSTDGWVRFIIPLHTPPAAAPAVAPLVRTG